MAEPLRAGDLQATLADGPELRDLRFRGVTILDGIALTVRGADWSTVPGHRVSRSLTTTGDAVRVVQSWRFPVGSGTVVGHLEIQLEPGAVSLALRLEVESAVEVNRAGLVLLHPLELVGRPVTLLGPSGRHQDRFPVRVSPHQPFRDLRGMVYSPVDGLTVDIDFGDSRYETEDHRNWCDAGWKSYTPPLAEPVPLRLRFGDRRDQRVRISVSSDRPSGPAVQDRTPRVRILPDVSGVLPALGWGAGPQSPDARSDRVADPDFLTVEVLADDAGRQRLRRAVAQAEARRLPLRVTVAARATEAAGVVQELARFAAQISHVCLVDPETHVSDDALVRTAAAALAGTSIAVGAGTRGYLAELGRSAAGFAYAQFVQLSISAEVHHEDDERIMDTTRALPFVVDSARAAAGGLPLVVAPITLAQRLSVHEPATDRYAPWDPTVQPDRRAGESFGAAWCLAGVAGLLGAEALGYFSVTPGHGLFDGEGRPTAAASLLSELAGHEGRAVRRCEISDPRRVAALALSQGEGVTLYLANLGPGPTTVLVDRSVAGEPVVLPPFAVKRLVSGNAAPHRAARRELSGEE